jgi:hypothetical protein
MRIRRVYAVTRKVFRFDLVLRFFARSVALLFLAPSLVLVPGLVLTSSLAASPVPPEDHAEAAEAWDAVKETTNPALLEAFIKRFSTTFFAELAKARLDELKATATKPPPLTAPKAVQTYPIEPGQKVPTDGLHQRAVLYEEDLSDQQGRQSIGSVTWRTELVKATGKPDELIADADVDIPSRGLRMTMSFKRNLDPILPASHEIRLAFQVSTDRGDSKRAGDPDEIQPTGTGHAAGRTFRQSHRRVLPGRAVKYRR